MTKPLALWRKRWEQHFYRWTDKRSPQAPAVTLTHKNLYTFPNHRGFIFLALAIIIWLLGTNYQNNLILALSYLLISLFVSAILHGYSNMAGLTVRVISASPAFAGEAAAFTLELQTIHKKGCDHLELRWPGGDTQSVNLDYMTPQQITLWAPSERRGYWRPGRLLVQSRFPLGIIRCWSWINLDAVALIYPKPIAINEPRPQNLAGQHAGENHRAGGDDFHSLREYQPGDPIKHIAWKQFAKEKGLFIKEYQEALSAEKWLNWDDLNYPHELRLSGLCYWALKYEQHQQSYGVNLPGLSLAPSYGSAQRAALLTALGEFPHAAQAGAHNAP
jgi:uncharacterized protein (DUF58 family)